MSGHDPHKQDAKPAEAGTPLLAAGEGKKAGDAAPQGASVPKKRLEKPDAEKEQLPDDIPAPDQFFPSEETSSSAAPKGRARAKRTPRAERHKAVMLLAHNDEDERTQLWDLFESRLTEQDHSVNNEGHFNMSNYGAVLFGCAEKNTEQAFLDKLHHWGGPTKLFLYSWCLLIPILVPLFYITKENLSPDYQDKKGEGAVGHFRCRRLDRGTMRRAICNATFPMPMLFPVISSMLALGFVTWRMCQQRVYYVLLRNKILIDLSHFKVHLTSFTRTCELVMIGMVCVHFTFSFVFGYQRDVDPVKARGDTYLLTVNMTQILRDPLVLLDEAQGPLLEFMQDIYVDYLLPALVSVFFVLTCAEADGSLIPLSQLSEAGANYAIRHLSGSIICNGDVTRDLLIGKPHVHKEAGDGVEPLRKQIHEPPSKQDAKLVCKAFRKEALGYTGVSWAGGADVETACPSGRRRVPLTAKHYHIWDLLFQPWWPLKIIFAEDRSGYEQIQFRMVWGVHCMLCFVVMAMNTYVVGYAFQWTFENTDHGKFCAISTATVYYIFLTPIGIIHVMSLVHLAANIAKAFS